MHVSYKCTLYSQIATQLDESTLSDRWHLLCLHLHTCMRSPPSLRTRTTRHSHLGQLGSWQPATRALGAGPASGRTQHLEGPALAGLSLTGGFYLALTTVAAAAGLEGRAPTSNHVHLPAERALFATGTFEMKDIYNNRGQTLCGRQCSICICTLSLCLCALSPSLQARRENEPAFLCVASHTPVRLSRHVTTR
jgi:hypothetical protein